MCYSYGDDLFRKWEEDQILLKQHQERSQILVEENYCYLSSITTVKLELHKARHEYDSLSKNVKMLTSSTQSLQNMSDDEKSRPNKMGLGYSISSSVGTSTTVFIKASSKIDQCTNPLPVERENHIIKKRWVCHFWGKHGHILSFCYRLHGFPSNRKVVRKNKSWKTPKTVWRPKTSNDANRCNVALTSIQTSRVTDWYFDSGSSRHMTGNANFFFELKEFRFGSVMFGDGVKDKVIGKGNMSKPGLQILKNVRHVNGLSAMISISQLCDEGFDVKFLKGRCLVTDRDETLIMIDARFYDNCY